MPNTSPPSGAPGTRRVASPSRAPRKFKPQDCQICGETYVPTANNSNICENLECFRERNRRNHKAWRDKNHEHVKMKARTEYAKNGAARERLSRYGVTGEEFDAMLAEQGGLCAICSRPMEFIGRGPNLDHNHETGVARQALCGPCNSGLGNFSESIERLLSAIAYLRKHA